jgi:hypothetical protein
MSTTSARLPSQADQDAPSTVPIPLRERKRDWFFVGIFTIFASTSALIDTANTVGRPNPHSRNPMARFVYEHAGGIDPVLIANPRFVQLTVGFVSAMLFGVFYLVLIYAFVRGREWIRLPAVFYAGMVVMGTGLYWASESWVTRLRLRLQGAECANEHRGERALPTGWAAARGANVATASIHAPSGLADGQGPQIRVTGDTEETTGCRVLC